MLPGGDTCPRVKVCALRVLLVIIIIIIIIIIIVNHPLYESRMHWIPDPTPPPPRRTGMDYSDTPVQSSDTPVQSRDICMNPRDTQVKSRNAHAKSRTSPVLTSDTQASAIATSASQELLSPRLIPESQGEGGGEGIAAQPMRIQRPAQPPQ